jgi:hypothetical protein
MSLEAALGSDRIPLIVGVTGHRDILAGDEGALYESFRSILRGLRAKHPDTPLLVLTALAAGADVVAAEAALVEKIPVIAHLPMAVAAYDLDFADAERSRFHAVLDRCSCVTVAAPHERRESAYIAAGIYISHYSDLLVAFWDGVESQGAGGTSYVVRVRTRGVAATVGSLNPTAYAPDVGPVIHVVTPRSRGARPPDAFGVRRLYPRRFHGDESAERDYVMAFDRLNRFNRDLRGIGVAPSDAYSGLSLMDRTDRAANNLQRRAVALVNILYAFAFLAASSQILFVTGDDTAQVWKLLTLLFAFLAYQAVRRGDLENRYQDYRALAEGLRVQAAWSSAGLRGELVEPYYLRMQQSELLWIRMALRSAYLISPEGGCPGSSNTDPSDSMVWIRGQWRYYHRAGHHEARNASRFARARKAALVASLIVGVLALLQLIPQAQNAYARIVHLEHIEGMKHWLAVATAMLAMAAALLGSYAGKRGFSSNAKRYTRMFVVFDHALRQLAYDRRSGAADTSHVLRDLGREALIEQADWLLTRRERPLSVVAE